MPTPENRQTRVLGDTAPQACGLLPGDVGEPVLDLGGQLGGCLAEHSEVPQQRLAAQPVGLQRLKGQAVGQLVGSLSGFDHLAEQEQVTLHTEAGPRRARRA